MRRGRGRRLRKRPRTRGTLKLGRYRDVAVSQVSAQPVCRFKEASCRAARCSQALRHAAHSVSRSGLFGEGRVSEEPYLSITRMNQ